MRVSHRSWLGHELALYSEGNGDLVEDPQLGSGSVTSVPRKGRHSGASKEGGWRGVHAESVLPDKVEQTLLGPRVLPPVTLRWHLGAPTTPEPPHRAPCDKCGIHPILQVRRQRISESWSCPGTC